MNLISLLKFSVKKYSQKTALIDSSTEKSVTYEELYLQIKFYASFLEKYRITKNMRVALLLDNSIEAIILLYALLYIGAIPVLLDVKFTSREIAECLKIASTNIIIYSQNGQTIDSLEELIVKRKIKIFSVNCTTDNLEGIIQIPNEPTIDKQGTEIILKTKLILFTYRGYGYPLAVLHDEASLMYGVISSIKLTKSTSSVRVSLLLPLSHIFSLTTNIFAPLSIGATIVLFNAQLPRVMLQAFEDYKVNFIIAVPTLIKVFLYILKNSKLKLSFLKRGIIGGDSLAKEIFDEWREVTGCNLVEGFGLTETSPVICNSWNKNKPNSIGRAMHGVEVKILDKDGNKSCIGVLYIKSKTNFLRYLNDNKELSSLTDNGWFNTGDIVEQDEEGFMFFKGRDKAITKIGGSTVDLVELKQVISKIFNTRKIKIKISVEDDYLWNQKIICAITIKRGYSKSFISKSFVIEKCKKELAAYKIPKQFIISKE